MNSLDGKAKLCSRSMRGKVVLIVNVASRCGFTPHHMGLEKIYEKYKDQNRDPWFPRQQFRRTKEPGTIGGIETFCSSPCQVTFPMYSEVSVKVKIKCTPLYQFLTDPKGNRWSWGRDRWNFTKFLVDRNGKVNIRSKPATTSRIGRCHGAIEKLLIKVR